MGNVTITAIVVVGATVIWENLGNQTQEARPTNSTSNGDGHCYQSKHVNAINSCDKEAAYDFDIKENAAYKAFKFPAVQHNNIYLFSSFAWQRMFIRNLHNIIMIDCRFCINYFH